jgi:hypothetical protein
MTVARYDHDHDAAVLAAYEAFGTAETARLYDMAADQVARVLRRARHDRGDHDPPRDDCRYCQRDIWQGVPTRRPRPAPRAVGHLRIYDGGRM